MHPSTRRDGDPFAEFALPLLDLVHDLAMTLTDDPAEAVGLTEQTFVRGRAAFAALGPAPASRAWLLRVAYGTWQREAGRRGLWLLEVADDGGELEPVLDLRPGGGHGDAAVQVATSQVVVSGRALRPRDGHDRLRRALARLPEPFRATFVLTDVHGLTTTEVAVVTSAPRSLVVSRVHRARACLRVVLPLAQVLDAAPCAELGEHLTAYSLGELDGIDETHARGHATACRSCTAVLLGHRQLGKVLRGAAAPAPERVRERVQAALGSAGSERSRRLAARTGLAALLVVVVAAAGLLVRPLARNLAGRARAPTPSTLAARPAEPMRAAWAAFEAVRLPVGPAGSADLGLLDAAPGRAELLVPLELYVTEEGALMLAGHRATATEYQGRAGLLVVFRWRPRLPAGDPPERMETRQTRWGRSYGLWWTDGQVVSLVLGSLRPSLFRTATERIQRAERRAGP